MCLGHFFFQSALPDQFWGESIKTVVYLINQTPTPLLKRKSPFEIIFQKPPNYSHLRVFSCLC